MSPCYARPDVQPEFSLTQPYGPVESPAITQLPPVLAKRPGDDRLTKRPAAGNGMADSRSHGFDQPVWSDDFDHGLFMSAVSLWGGVLADRYDRKKILLLTQAFTASNLLVLALLSEADVIATWQVYVSSAGLGAAQAMTMPARTAMVRSLVGPEDLKNAITLNMVQMQSAQVIWPSIVGVIISLAGVSAALATSSGLAFLGIALLTVVHTAPVGSQGEARSPLRELVEGLSYSFSAPRVSTLMGMAFMVGLFGLPFMSMAPGFAREVLNFGAGNTGLFMMASGLGSIAGSVFIMTVQVRDNLRLYFVGSGFMGLSIALLGLIPWAYAEFLPAAGFGFCLSVMIVGGQTLLQMEVPPNILGRTSSVWSLVAAIGFVASAPIGFAADAIGLRAALGGAGLILVLLCSRQRRPANQRLAIAACRGRARRSYFDPVAGSFEIPPMWPRRSPCTEFQVVCWMGSWADDKGGLTSFTPPPPPASRRLAGG